MTGDYELVLLSAILLGFVGSGHCLGMCGGIAGALGQATVPALRSSPLFSSVLYSLGRIASYGLLGTFAGLFGESVNSVAGAGPTLRVLTGLLIVAFGVQAADWGWSGVAWIERAGLRVWRRLLPVVGRVGRPDRIWKVVMLGALWGWLPCGLVYSGLAVAAVTGTPLRGGVFMLCFGLGTLPALVVAGGAAARLSAVLQKRGAKRAVGVLLVVFGCWTIFMALVPAHTALHGSSHGPSQEGVGHDAMHHESIGVLPTEMGRPDQ